MGRMLMAATAIILLVTAAPPPATNALADKHSVEPCRAEQLAASASWQGTTGARVGPVVVEHRGGEPCWLPARPELDIVDRNLEVIPTEQMTLRDEVYQEQVIEYRDTASVSFWWLNYCGAAKGPFMLRLTLDDGNTLLARLTAGDPERTPTCHGLEFPSELLVGSFSVRPLVAELDAESLLAAPMRLLGSTLVCDLRTDGQYVVFADDRTPGYGLPGSDDGDLFAVNLISKELIEVAGDPGFQDCPDVDGGIVVWTDGAEGGQIRAMRLATGETFTVSDTPGSNGTPKISGDLVVWSRWEESRSTFYIRNIGTMAPSRPILEWPADIGGALDLDGDRIVWLESRDERLDADTYAVHWRLQTKMIDDAQTMELVNDTALFDYVPSGDTVELQPRSGADRPADFAFAGDTIVFPRWDFPESASLVVINAVTGQETVLKRYPAALRSFDAEADVLELYPVATDGQWIYWLETDAEYNTTVWGLNQETGWATPVVTEARDGGFHQFDLMHAANGALAWSYLVPSLNPDENSPVVPTEIHGAVVAILLTFDRQPPYPVAEPLDDGILYFPETAHSLGERFEPFWLTNGGIPVFGFPMTEPFWQQGSEGGQIRPMQLFERQRLEWHEELAGTPYEVLLGRLGVEQLTAQGVDWVDLPQARPDTRHYMPETGHAIAPEFWDYWSGNGLDLGDPGTSFRESLALFGFPISEPMIETNADGDTVLTQYFERVVFEHHPAKPEPYQVLLRRLGVEDLGRRGWESPARSIASRR